MAKRDLYEELGISRDADGKEIKRAYRRKAKEAHPDAGGSAVKFAQVRSAALILSDPARRARYDQTGDAEEVAPDNTQAAALSIIAQSLDAIVDQAPDDPAKLDVIGILRDGIAKQISAQCDQILALQEKLKRTKKLCGRFMKRGDNALERLCRANVVSLEQQIRDAETEIARRELALTILKDYIFDREVEPMETATFGFSGFLRRAARSP